ncbi:MULTISPECIES: ketopantoate reductase family protein [unclassified Sporolactobacillus]|uniref:ketopantoate reductase family protein n=1 Tax=unclassified Sporolactobacillus TaxID=2628533 RepID=UPI002367F62D|nr:2-dehydropantoate 2-reductase [Sporolactobacillus sp. CQH2019]MDD9150070.1 2-dehydropantoate 2-reductase [Sporolactobacillus sp. CQH2019]
MKVAVLGAGAIGCFFGGLLAREKQDVTFVARGRTLDYLLSHDLMVKSINGDFSLPVKAADAEHLQRQETDFDFVLLSVKSTALTDVMPALRVLTGQGTRIICLLNGIGNEEKLADEFGADRIVGGSAFISIIREAPGIVNHVGEGTLVIGGWQGDGPAGVPNKKLDELAGVLRSAGIKAEVTDHIRRIKWEKLLWNITYNPVTALTGTRVGEALDDPDVRRLLLDMKSEFMKTARAAGVAIRPKFSDNVLLPNKEVRNHKTSMLQDLENGRKMELEAILGFAIEVAHEHRVPVKTIESIYHLLCFIERKRTLSQGVR